MCNISSNFAFYGEEFSASRPVPSMEHHPFSVVQGLLFDTFCCLSEEGQTNEMLAFICELCAVFKKTALRFMLHYKSCAWNGPLRGDKLTPGHTVLSSRIPLGLAMLADTFIGNKIAFFFVNMCRFSLFSKSVLFLLSTTDENIFDLDRAVRGTLW
jgi:hypothetical protein